jgi:hypothetical protein
MEQGGGNVEGEQGRRSVKRFLETGVAQMVSVGRGPSFHVQVLGQDEIFATKY